MKRGKSNPERQKNDLERQEDCRQAANHVARQRLTRKTVAAAAELINRDKPGRLRGGAGPAERSQIVGRGSVGRSQAN